MSITVYRSTDASAPVLSGSAGAMVALLDACLVNGYGAKPAAGWAKEFTATNKGVYRAATGTRFRLRVDDAGTTTCRVVGYETMTDVDTGTKAYPVEAQVAGGLYWIKSDAASAAARPWILIASPRHFLLLININNAATPNSSHNCFGDFVPLRQNDSYNSIIIGSIGTTATNTNSRGFGVSQYTYILITGHYVARLSTGIAGSQPAGKHVAYTTVTNSSGAVPSGMGSSTGNDFAGNAALLYPPTYPISIVGGIIVEPVYVTDSQGLRGILPGLWNLGHNNAQTAIGSHGDQFLGSGHHLIGKTFELWRWTVTTTTLNGGVAIEVSDTWQI